MIRSGILITLLSLWLFAIFAPSVISLLENDGKSIVTVNLNEEEQQEQGKKDIDENQVVQNGISDFSYVSKLGNSFEFDFYLAKNLDNTLEIVLPPPERS